MAEVQQETSSQPTPDIASLTGAGDRTAISDLVTMQKARTAEDFSITRAADTQLSKDQARSEAAYKAEGIGHDELKPWDADKEHRKFEHDPIEGFGSVGGLFAMVASAFTKAPMDNAINGMAGALNSIKAGDEAAYERAYGSWKDNTKLALDRHKIQHDLYGDALSLMSANQGAAQAKLHNAAVRFGDSQMLTLAEHGMVKELFELQESRARAASQMQDLADKTDLRQFQRQAVKATLNGMEKTGDPMVDAIQLTAAIQRIYDPSKTQGTAEQAAVADFVLKHRNDPDFADKLADLHQKFSTRQSDPKVQAYNDQVSAWQVAHPGEDMPEDVQHRILEQTGNLGRPLGGVSTSNSISEPKLVAKEIQRRADVKIAEGKEPAVAFDEAMKEVKASQKGEAKSTQARKTEAIKEIQKKHADEGKPISIADAEAEYNRTVSTASGNRRDDLRGKIDQTDNIITGSQKNLDFLRQYKGGAGLMGKIMRGEEIASNIVGAGTQSDRVEFRRRVHELQEMVPRIITDSNGRPLKAAQDKVDDFVAGLNAGDTGPNTIRAYEELISEMQKRKKDYRGRLEGGYDPAAASSGAKPGAEGKKLDADWLNAYPVKGEEKESEAIMSDDDIQTLERYLRQKK